MVRCSCSPEGKAAGIAGAALMAVLLLGALLFHVVERPAEEAAQEETKQFIDAVQKSIASNDAMNTTQKTAMFAKLEQLMSAKQALVHPDTDNWGYLGSFFFVVTICTTIGYGTFAPQTMAGRFLVIVYGTVGLAIAAYAMSTFSTFALMKWTQVLKLILRHDPTLKEKTRGTLVLVLLVWFTGAGVMASSQGWTYDEGLYFGFVTLTTIGFGDYAPALKSGFGSGFVPWLIFVFFGIGIASAVIGLVQEIVEGGVAKAKNASFPPSQRIILQADPDDMTMADTGEGSPVVEEANLEMA